MGIDPANQITLDQVQLWLEGIAAGVIDLSRDNEGMARAALFFVAPPAPAHKEATDGDH
jgi:hypothetical protein